MGPVGAVGWRTKLVTGWLLLLANDDELEIWVRVFWGSGDLTLAFGSGFLVRGFVDDAGPGNQTGSGGRFV